MSICYIYIHAAFGTSATGISLFFSYTALLGFVVQGFLVNIVVPGFLSSAQATAYSTLLIGAQM